MALRNAWAGEDERRLHAVFVDALLAEQPMAAHGQTVIGREDDDRILALLELGLHGLGYTVITAASGSDALRYLDGPGAAEPDIIVSDMVMPDVGGRELIEKLRRGSRNIPAILMSGFADGIDGESVAAQPRVRFLQKPFSTDKLAVTIRELLGETSVSP